MDIRLINIDDKNYPDHLRQISDAPKKLYCIGNLELLKQPGIAVVGTRRASAYGKWVSYEIGRSIAKCGVTVISGMAYGIDGQAHRGCLDAEGNTIAVLGTSIDKAYPKSNESLYRQICSKGLVISEYGPNDTTGNWSFPARNRIISALSKAVIVAEGAEKSGSMITAGFALNQGRDVFAVPGNINQPNSVGVNLLIGDGATPITSLDRLPALLGIGERSFEKRIKKCTDEEAALLTKIMNDPGITIEKAAFECNMNIWESTAIISALELKGIVKREGNDIFLNC